MSSAAQRLRPLEAFARGLHQDALTGLSGYDDLARSLLSQLSEPEREAFRNWLPRALQTLSPSEMKGLLNRANTDLRFSSNAADRLLRAAAEQLGL